MSVKQKTIWVCKDCGNEYGAWLGKCPACGNFGTLVEDVKITGKNSSVSRKAGFLGTTDATPIYAIKSEDAGERLITGYSEVDSVLGGGFSSKSITVFTGEPGIGKSTLMMQVSHRIALLGQKVLYVSAEECVEEVRNRGRRLAVSDKILVSNESEISRLIALVQKESVDFLIVDSVQTIYDDTIESRPGTVSQVTNATLRLRELANLGVTIVMIGHVTKDGTLAGPRVLEHMVDVVLSFEGDSKNFWRILRASKNRFGSTQEIGVFAMTETGLSEVKNPSQYFLADADIPFLSGSVITSILEGTRPLFVELQVLVSKTNFSMPQRIAKGVDLKFLNIILAVLEKRVNYQMSLYDVFVNVIGGLTLKDPGVGLGLAVAVASSLLNIALLKTDYFVGEVGLSGELRPVMFMEKQISDAASLGYTRIFCPKCTLKKEYPGVKIFQTSTLSDLIDIVVAKNN